jgi:hypothetical protein
MRVGLMFIHCVLLSLSLGSGTVLASEHLDAATKGLSTTEVFAFGGVGYAGVISQGEVDFKILLSQSSSDALAAFETLYATGNPHAKAYALSGIKKLNPGRFKVLLASSSTKDQVKVMRGCIVSRESLHDVAAQIDQHKFRF